MKTIEDYYEYLKIESESLKILIRDNDKEFNLGRIYVMNRILSDLKSWVDLNSLEKDIYGKENVLEIK